MLNGKCTIYRDSEPCSAVRSVQKPLFRRYLPVRGSHSTHRCLEFEIWWFSWRQRQTDKTDCFTPCACAWGNKVHAYNGTSRNYGHRGTMLNWGGVEAYSRAHAQLYVDDTFTVLTTSTWHYMLCGPTHSKITAPCRLLQEGAVVCRRDMVDPELMFFNCNFHRLE